MGAESKLSAEAAARFVLGLSQGCSKEDVKRAFRRLALVFHPDKNKGQNEEEATKRFQAIATAKDLLLGTCLSGTARPGPPVAKKPSVVVHWVCGACQMRHLGSLGSRTPEPCGRATSSTLCFCRHRLGVHELESQGGGAPKLRCKHAGCPCGDFSYVPPGALCTCGHGPGSHDAKAFHGCQVSGCLCQTFHHAGVCSCRHGWACHRTELQKAGASPYAGTSAPSSFRKKKTFCPWRRHVDPHDSPSPSSSSSSTSDAETKPSPPKPRRSTPAPGSTVRAPSGREGVSAPSTPTGRGNPTRCGQSASADRFFPATARSESQRSSGSRPPVQPKSTEKEKERLDVRGQPIGRCPSVPTPARGVTPGVPATGGVSGVSATRGPTGPTGPTPRPPNPSTKSPEAPAPASTSKPAAPEAAKKEDENSKVPSETPPRAPGRPARPSSAPARRSPSEVPEKATGRTAARPPRPPSGGGAPAWAGRVSSGHRSSPCGPRSSSPAPGAAGRASSVGPKESKKAEEKERDQGRARSRSKWEDPSAEPDAEPDTTEASASPRPKDRSEHTLRNKRSASFSLGRPHGSPASIAALAQQKANERAAGRPWWERLYEVDSNSGNPPKAGQKIEAHSYSVQSLHTARSVDSSTPLTRPPSAPSGTPRANKPPVPKTAPVAGAVAGGRPASAPRARPTIPAEEAAPVAPPAVFATTTAAHGGDIGRPEAKTASAVVPPTEPKSEKERMPWHLASPRFFGADSDEEGGPSLSSTTRIQSARALTRLMELQRTLQTPLV